MAQLLTETFTLYSNISFVIKWLLLTHIKGITFFYYIYILFSIVE